MDTLSVIIICKNEANRIRLCLESIKDIANEIIVFDSGSTDNTVDIVKEYTDKVWITEWPGYGIQKQRALEQAKSDWVLSIDSDEYLDSEMKSSITQILNNKSKEEVAFKLSCGKLILVKQLKYGRSARAPIRLFKNENVHFTKDMVHEKIVTPKGKISVIKKGYLMHDSIIDFEHLLEKNRKYSYLTSKKYFNRNKKSYGVVLAVFRAMWTFLLIYIIRRGCLDGSRGLLMAMMFAQSSFNKYAGLWYLENDTKNKMK